MSKCMECGAKVRDSEGVCRDCLDVAAEWIKAMKKKPEVKETSG